METLVYFGNNSLQKGIFNVIADGARNASGQDVQSVPLARGTGASVVQTRLDPKIMRLRGILRARTAPKNLQKIIDDYVQLFNTDRSEYLRLVHDYTQIIPTNTVAGWSLFDDGINLALNTEDFQLGSSSVGFDIDVSASVDDEATLIYSPGSGGVDLSAVSGTGNLELWINIPDVQYVDDVFIRIGSDSSNFYWLSFTTDYMGYDLCNGSNLLSFPWDSWNVVGTPDDSALDYALIAVRYSASAEDMTGCYVDGIQWVNEERTRNYPCYRDGEINIQGNNFNNTMAPHSMQFLNHTGYRKQTHELPLFDSDGVTGVQDTQVFELEGYLDPRLNIRIDVNTATNIGSFEIKNLNTGQSVSLVPTSVTNGDVIIFGPNDLMKGKSPNSTKNGDPLDFEGIIPTANMGTNRLQMNITGSTGSSELTYEVNDGDELLTDDPTSNWIGQQFTAPLTGTLTDIELYLRRNGWGSSSTNPFLIYSDSANSPGTLLGSFVTPAFSNSALDWIPTSGIGVSVTIGAKYWIVSKGKSVFALQQVHWGLDSAAGYAGGIVKRSTDQGATWGSAVSQDMNFKLTVEPVPAWDIDWQATYTPLSVS